MMTVTTIWMLTLAVGPFLTIWTLNTLFHTAIPITFKTWLAAGLLNIFMAGIHYGHPRN